MRYLFLVFWFVTSALLSDEGLDKLEHAKWFNGNWLCVEHYGVSPKFGGSQEGVDAYHEVEAQKKAYTESKNNDDVDRTLKNAFNLSSQAWALNNKGFGILAPDGEVDSGNVDAAGEAKQYFERGLNIFKAEPEKSGCEKQTAYLRGELKQCNKAKAILEKNLTFCQMVLGEKPWPKKEDGQ